MKRKVLENPLFELIPQFFLQNILASVGNSWIVHSEGSKLEFRTL